MRRTRSACCARAASGHAAAAPPSSVMNSRRFTRSPRRRGSSIGGTSRPSAFGGLEADHQLCTRCGSRTGSNRARSCRGAAAVAPSRGRGRRCRINGSLPSTRSWRSRAIVLAAGGARSPPGSQCRPLISPAFRRRRELRPRPATARETAPRPAAPSSATSARESLVSASSTTAARYAPHVEVDRVAEQQHLHQRDADDHAEA